MAYVNPQRLRDGVLQLRLKTPQSLDTWRLAHVDFSGSPQSPYDIARHKAGEEGLCFAEYTPQNRPPGRLGKARPEGLQAAQIARSEKRRRPHGLSGARA